jgi:protein TonB
MAPVRYADTPTFTPRQRALLLMVIVVMHVLAGAALIRAFGGVRALADRVGLAPVISARVITAPPPPRHQTESRRAQGAGGANGRLAQADQIIAAPSPVQPAAMPAPPVAGTGSAVQSGASTADEGTGRGGSGDGPGSGGAGTGTGGGTRPVKIAGDLAEADYPKAGRAKRLGTAVIVVLTVGTDGRVTACRVHQPSGDPDADAVTCRVASERFRFTPAHDAAGNPVVAQFGWQQRFFVK